MKITIVGQGYVGLPISVCAAEAGHTVLGFDIDEKKISKLKLGISDSPEVSTDKLIDLQLQNKIKFSSSIKDSSGSAIYIIAVPTPLDSEHKPDLSFLTSACGLIAQVIEPKSLIINESTSYIGTLRNLIKPIVDRQSGLTDLNYAVAPERIDPGNKFWSVKNTPRNIAGLTAIATQQSADFYSSFCDSVNVVSSPEVAECSKLFENTFRQVNIALVNEFSEVLDKIGINAHEVVEAASTKPFGFMKFQPSIGVGGHCIPVDPEYLVHFANKVGVELKLINIANEINLHRPKQVAHRIEKYMGGDLNRKKIQIAGIAYKTGVSDIRESPALELMVELINLGAVVSWHDPIVRTHLDQRSVPLDPLIDLGIVVAPHAEINFKTWKDAKILVLDLSVGLNNLEWPKFL